MHPSKFPSMGRKGKNFHQRPFRDPSFSRWTGERRRALTPNDLRPHCSLKIWLVQRPGAALAPFLAAPPRGQRLSSNEIRQLRAQPGLGSSACKCGGRGLPAHWSKLGGGAMLHSAPTPLRVKWAFFRLLELFIGGWGLSLFTRCHWLDLNRLDCGQAAGRVSRGLWPAADSFSAEGPTL